jgi:IS5 family transposase
VLVQTGGVLGVSDSDRELLDALALCGHLVAPGTVHALLAEHRLRLFPDEMFADLFPNRRGRPSVPADVVATVMVLQALENLSDRDAVRALRTNIAWKVAAGLPLDDVGFHPTVLTLWRNKLRATATPERIFDAVRGMAAQSGVLSGRTRRVLDSTVLDDCVTREDAIMQLVAQIRRVRRVVPEVQRAYLRGHDYDDPARKPVCDWDDRGDVDRVVTLLVNDALDVLLICEPLDLNSEQAEAVGLLALVAGQDSEPGERPGTWRIAQRTAPDRMVSTVDPESRHVHKTTSVYRDGYKAHIAVEPDTGLITACELTAGNVGDAQAAPGLLEQETSPVEVLGDSAYGSGEFRQHLTEVGHSAVIKPGPLGSAVPGGFTLDDFDINTTEQTVECPAGHVVKIRPSRTASFTKHCGACPLRQHCTTAKKGRVIQLHEHHDLLAAARRQASTAVFQDIYRRHRPMVERTIAWLTRRYRKVRYRGIERNNLGLAMRCAAINLTRLVNLGITHNGTRWTTTA